MKKLYTILCCLSLLSLISCNNQNKPIQFEGVLTKQICVKNWDSNGDGELSYAEAAAVTKIGEVFHDTYIVYFAELKHFTRLTKIDDSAFEDFTSLASITIPKGVTSIGDSAFSGCSSLASIKIPKGVTSIGYNAFGGCIFSKDNFINNSNLDAEARYYWGASVYDIVQEDGLCINGTTAVNCRPNSVAVIIPDGVTEIGDFAFEDCTSLASITIPKGVTSIGDLAFSDCTSLASVTIGDGVTEIGDLAFSGCTSLASVTIGDGVTEIGDCTFSGCTSLASVTIGDGVTEIGDSAFYGCTSLASVTIGDGVTEIGDSAFYGCSNLTSVIIPDSVTEIHRSAFEGCTNLTNLIYSNNIQEVGERAFEGCVNLRKYPKSKIPNWLYGNWRCVTPYGTLLPKYLKITRYTVTEYDKYGVVDSGSFTVDDDVLRVEFSQDAGIVTTFELDERRHMIYMGGGYYYIKTL